MSLKFGCWSCWGWLLCICLNLFSITTSKSNPTPATTTSMMMNNFNNITERIFDTIAPLPSMTSSVKSNDVNNAMNCPNEMFKCLTNDNSANFWDKIRKKINNNIFESDDDTKQDSIDYDLDDLFSRDKTMTPKFICIDNTRVCNGQNDCPNGQDESSELCIHKQNQSNRLHEDHLGCYLCRNSKKAKNKCISLTKLCDNHFDCPDNDDEENCNKNHIIKGGQSQPILTSMYDSKFSANQYGTTNINIINRDSGNLQKNPQVLPKDQSPFATSFDKNEHGGNGRDVSNNEGTKQPLVQDGVGFQFRVNNLVVYNSVLKMFNQGSDNVASKETDPNETTSETLNGEHYRNYNYSHLDRNNNLFQ